MTPGHISTLSYDRYAQQMLLAEVGQGGQERLAQARVLCVGAGGLGCAALWYLAAAGIGKLGIVDHDIVELSNLHRQTLYTPSDVGMLKVQVAQERLALFNPDIFVVAHPISATSEAFPDLLDDYDVILDGTDNTRAHDAINQACRRAGKTWVHAGVVQWQGYCTVFTKESACYACLLPSCRDQDFASALAFESPCSQVGVLGAWVGVLGTLQAHQVLQWILMQKAALVGQLLVLCGQTLQMKIYQLTADPDCIDCTLLSQDTLNSEGSISEITVHDLQACYPDDLLKKRWVLLDVREEYERQAGCLTPSLWIPLKQLSGSLQQLDPHAHYVVYCKSGGRSQNACLFLKKQGFKHVTNLIGGLLAWRQHVNSKMVVV